MTRLALRLTLAGWLSAAAMAQSETPALPPPSVSGVRYGTHERHVLDLWQAKADAPAPLLIFIHGGGWHGGDKSDLPPKLLAAMLARGVSVASINYRYTHMAIVPAPLHDAARAVQVLRSRAVEWRLDPRRFGGHGISAGACSVLWLACHDDLAQADSPDPVARLSTRLQVVVGMSPPVCLEPQIARDWVGEQVLQHPMMARAVGAPAMGDLKQPRPEWIALLREASAITHVSADDPPILLSYPRFDRLPAETPGSAIHHANFGVKFQQAAQAAGASCVLRIEDQDAARALPAPDAFLIEHLTRAR